MWVFSLLFSRIGIGIMAAALLFGGYHIYKWQRAADKRKIANLITENNKLKVDKLLLKIEVEYAPKIEPMRKIAKRRTPKTIKPVVIQTAPPPKVDPAEWADAVSVAQSINDYWGLRPDGKKSLPGKASDARVWPPPGRTHAQC